MKARSRERVGDRFRIEDIASSSKAQSFWKVPSTRWVIEGGEAEKRRRAEDEARDGGIR